MITQDTLTFGKFSEDAYVIRNLGFEFSNGFTVTATINTPGTGLKAFSAYNGTTNTLVIA